MGPLEPAMAYALGAPHRWRDTFRPRDRLLGTSLRAFGPRPFSGSGSPGFKNAPTLPLPARSR